MFSCTCSQEELGFATFRLSNSSLGSKNSSLGPSALGMNFFSLGMNYSLQVAKPNSSFLQCTKLYNLCGRFCHSAVWKLAIFSQFRFLREINFGWFKKIKSFHFNHFGGFEFIYFTWKCQKLPEIQYSELLKLSKWQILRHQNDQQCKIDFT